MSKKSPLKTEEAPSAVTLEASNVDQTTTKGDTMNSSTVTESSQLPVIAGHEIDIDQHGRFNLNAIHRASGESSHKLPSQWARRGESQDLIAELKSQSADIHFEPLSSVRGGAHRGTYAHELLAVSYAGWISPRFQLQVNQVFLDYRMGNLEAKQPSLRGLPNPLTPAHQRGIQKAIARRANALPKPAQRSVFSRIYSHLKDRFEVGSYKDIDDSRYTEALAAIETVSLDGEWLAADPKPEAGLHLNDYQAHNMWVIFSHIMHITSIYDHYQLYEHLTGLGSPAGIKMHDHIKEGSLLARLLVRQVESELHSVRRRLDLPERGLLH